MLQSEVVGAGTESAFATINPPSVSMSVLLSMSPYPSDVVIPA